MLKTIKRGAQQWWQGPDKKYFCVMLGFAAVVYFPLISQKLTNTFDGLWMDTYYIANVWELSIGRWLWPLADALRFGVQTDPINSLLTLSLVSFSFILIRKLFAARDSILTYLLGMAFVSSAICQYPAVVSLYVANFRAVAFSLGDGSILHGSYRK